jgi:hypothetical protein
LELDIGTGSGLLAMLAAKAGAESVVAIDMFPAVAGGIFLCHDVVCKREYTMLPLLDMAKAVIDSNHLELGGKVHVFCCHSKDLVVDDSETKEIKKGRRVQLPRRVDCLLSELLDSTLLGEGIIPTVRDAWKRLLKPGAIVVPAAARIFVQIVESQELASMQDVSAARVSSCHEGILEDVTLARDDVAMECRATSASPVRLQSLNGTWVGPDEATREDKQSNNQFKNLSEPCIAFEIDFTSEDSLPPLEGQTAKVENELPDL